ncbi:MAG: transposase, partial [Thermoprotei archaeon]
MVIRKVWDVKKSYLKIHFGVDVKTKHVVSMAVTSERVHDGRVLKRLVRGAFNVVRVRRLLGDGGYDSRENFSFLERVGVKPVIKVRRNASSRSKGCASRRQVVLELQLRKKSITSTQTQTRTKN